MGAKGTCNNCGADIYCGCQRETASDGKSCCTSCIKQYENSIGNGTKQNKTFVWNIGKK